MQVVRAGAVVVLAIVVTACGEARKQEAPQQATDDCSRCHGYPPPQNGPFIAATTTSHPAGATDCSSCHGDTVLADDITIKPGGLHMNGVVEALGHAEGYDDPTQHGPDAIAFLAGAGTSTCTDCHGATLTGGAGPSCASCHDAVVDDWKTNCTFCHGATTRLWSVTDLALAAPPEAVDGSPDATRIGAHQKHLRTGTLAPARPCASCHVVPGAADALHHFEANGSRGELSFDAFASKGTVAAYAGAGGTCTTYCHGSGDQFANPANQASPAWSATGIACDGCHGLPPQSGGTFPAPNPHAFHVTQTNGPQLSCNTCHPGYSISGSVPTVNVATHVNGTKEVVGNDRWSCTTCHTQLGVPIMHPPLGDQHMAFALADIASCRQCHGATYGGGSGPSCNGCHDTQVTASAPDWKTNCTFCHGTRTDGVTTATALAAPPQSVAATGAQDNTNSRIGAHQRHLAGGAYSNALACGSCHAVPTDALGHFTGENATIEFSTLAKQGVTTPGYAGSGGACAVYCHGSGTQFANPPGKVSPAWTSTPMACDACHGQPPTSGPVIGGTDAHAFHAGNGETCGSCHSGYGTGVNKALHVNGAKDAIGDAAWSCSTCHAAVSKPRTHAAAYVATHATDALADIAACARCHGSDYSVEFLGAGSSCNGCHGLITASAPDWKTNCSFCHGTRTANVTSAAAAAAPPQAVVNIGDQTRTNPRVGAHQRHLTAGRFSSPLPCSTCHNVPTGAQSLAHFAYAPPSPADQVAVVAFDALARQGAAGATYDRAAGSCAVYCHGSGTSWPTGSVSRVAAWTSTALACDACHASRPATGPAAGNHGAMHATTATGGPVPCTWCHLGYVQDATVDLGLHVNGARDVVYENRGGGVTTVSAPSWANCTQCHTGDATGNKNAPTF
ncbi:MAG TPA: CxxxxCH/CxxCH domain-containing protein [Anaeromyxobacter sp.]|nr:CxxxxCH/CxxCH domain-containing protein [Anaeromyxobacter sp.]